ncbi:MAG: hypothetical protein Q9190_001940 [Brigantiaea leucoxantha]
MKQEPSQSTPTPHLISTPSTTGQISTAFEHSNDSFDLAATQQQHVTDTRARSFHADGPDAVRLGTESLSFTDRLSNFDTGQPAHESPRAFDEAFTHSQRAGLDVHFPGPHSLHQAGEYDSQAQGFNPTNPFSGRAGTTEGGSCCSNPPEVPQSSCASATDWGYNCCSNRSEVSQTENSFFANPEFYPQPMPLYAQSGLTGCGGDGNSAFHDCTCGPECQCLAHFNPMDMNAMRNWKG